MISNDYPNNLLNDIFDINCDIKVNMDELEDSLNYIFRKEKFNNRVIDVFNCRYRLGQPLAEIGKKYFVTRERIRQIQAKIIHKLKKPENLLTLQIGVTQMKNRKNVELKEFGKTIDSLGLSSRSLHYLKNNGITQVDQLMAMSDEEIMSIRNLGATSLKDIKEKIDFLKQSMATPEQDIAVIMQKYSLSYDELIDKIYALSEQNENTKE